MQQVQQNGLGLDFSGPGFGIKDGLYLAILVSLYAESRFHLMGKNSKYPEMFLAAGLLLAYVSYRSGNGEGGL